MKIIFPVSLAMIVLTAGSRKFATARESVANRFVIRFTKTEQGKHLWVFEAG